MCEVFYYQKKRIVAKRGNKNVDKKGCLFK